MRLPLNKAWIVFLEGISYGHEACMRVNYTTGGGVGSDREPASSDWSTDCLFIF